MPPNSPPNTLTSSVSVSIPSVMPLAGGMSMERNVAIQIPCYKSLLTYLPVSLLFAAFGTAARKVACRFLHENDTALSALNLYWRVGVDIINFQIVEFSPCARCAFSTNCDVVFLMCYTCIKIVTISTILLLLLSENK